MGDFFFSLLFFNHLIFLGYSCGAGGAAPSSSPNHNSDEHNLARDIFSAVSLLPGDSSGLTEGVITDYITKAVQNVLEGDIKVSHYDSGSKGQPIKCPADLNCDFSKPCRWRNVKDEDLEYYKATGHPKLSNLESYTGTLEPPKTPSLLTAGNKGSNAAWLVSDEIKNQSGNGSIEFKYWATPLLEIKICTRDVSSSKLGTCVGPFVSSNSPGPFKAIVVGPKRKPFEIVFTVSNFIIKPGGFAIIDDIVYRGNQPCNGTNATESLEITSTPNSAQATTSKMKYKLLKESHTAAMNLSQLLDCSFDEFSPCHYNISGKNGHKGFRLHNGPVGNIHTGIRHDIDGNSHFKGGYLVADGSDSTVEISDFITTSPPFLLESPKKLHFYHWQGSAQTTLKICVNFVCPWRFNHIARDWAKEEIHLDPDAISLACNKATAEKCGTVDNARSFTRTTSQLMFIAEGVKKFHYLAIDQIRITES